MECIGMCAYSMHGPINQNYAKSDGRSIQCAMQYQSTGLRHCQRPLHALVTVQQHDASPPPPPHLSLSPPPSTSLAEASFTRRSQVILNVAHCEFGSETYRSPILDSPFSLINRKLDFLLAIM